MSYSVKALEFDLILERVSKYAKTKTTEDTIKHLKPYDNLEYVILNLNQTQEALVLISKFGSFPLLENFDVAYLLKSLEIGQSLSIKELLSLRLFLTMSEDVIAYKKEFKRQKTNLVHLEPFFELNSKRELILEIESIMDSDGVILDQASDTLYGIRRQIKKLEQARKELLNQLLQKRASQLNEQMIVIRNDRYCLPVKSDYRNSFKGIIHDESASGTTIFIEPIETLEKTVDIERFHYQETQEIIRILSAISDDLRPHVFDLTENMHLLLALDFIQAKAKYALETNSFMPEMNDQGIVELIDARHPLIDPKQVVPISLMLNKEKKTIMITGPNTGGKTVALKTVGLLSIMAQCGLLVPLKSLSKLSTFSGVYADIGDEQSIIQSLSTFSSHLTKIKKIVDEVKDGVLILFDELGSGTDPQEGSALAMGILDYLEAYDIRMIVTTHYSELKIYAYTHPNIANASVAFDIETLRPLYKINYGISGASNALSIAHKLGLSADVIKLAKTYTDLKENDLTRSIKMFETESMLVKEKEQSLSEQIALLELNNKKLSADLNALEANKDKILKDTQALADKKLKQTLEKAEALLIELSSKDIKDHEIASLKYEFKNLGVTDIDNKINPTFKKGDYVYIKSYDQTGQIKSVSKGSYTVKFGMFEMPFKAAELSYRDKPIERAQAIKKKATSAQTIHSDAKMTLDLRGFRFEDVKDELEKFLDTATLNHLKSVSIIHGFGTGAVRKAVYDVLKKSPYVKEYRFGGEGEGLNGATIVTIN